MPKIFKVKLHYIMPFKSTGTFCTMTHLGCQFAEQLGQCHFDALISISMMLQFLSNQRLETTKLLLDNGADPFAKSRYGDDALQTACLRGAHNIFNHLKSRITFPTERLASANELIGKLNSKRKLVFSTHLSIISPFCIHYSGSTYLDEHNETRLALLHWRLAHHIRLQESTYIGKTLHHKIHSEALKCIMIFQPRLRRCPCAWPMEM